MRKHANGGGVLRGTPTEAAQREGGGVSLLLVPRPGRRVETVFRHRGVVAFQNVSSGGQGRDRVPLEEGVVGGEDPAIVGPAGGIAFDFVGTELAVVKPAVGL